MGVIDFILNLACVLLWLSWRSFPIALLENSPPVSLASTLKKAEPRASARWVSLASLAAVIVVRSFFYWTVGSGLNWTPALELGVISLPFRSDYLGRMFLYSLLSFGLMAAGFYAWLLLLSVINRQAPSDEPVQKLVRLHLGWLESWPSALKLMLPMIVTVILWVWGSRGLIELGIVPAPVSKNHLWQQAMLLGVTSCFLSWRFLVLGLCLLYLINSYVYLGNAHIWKFVNMTGANLLAPLRRLPICFGKLDLSPVLAIILVAAGTHWATRWLPKLFQHLPL